LPADHRRRFLLAFCVCVAMGALGGVLVATLGDVDPDPAVARFTPPAEKPYDFHLTDQDGRKRSLRDARGKVVVLTFVYSTCRDFCPYQGGVIGSALAKVRSPDVVLYAVTVDPVGDTPERVQAWLNRYGLRQAPVRFLNGSRRELAPVWAAYGIVPINATEAEAEAGAAASDRIDRSYEGEQYVYTPRLGSELAREESKAAGVDVSRRPAPAAGDEYPAPDDQVYRGRRRHAALEFEHSAYVLLIDKQGRQRVGFPFEQLDDDLLAHDMRTLLAER
jgi:cytochrome oxidase Cu insertion factor (SCO1/SenC/PrrC family)